MTQKEISDALVFLRPGAEWLLADGVVTWMDKAQAEPSDTEIQQAIIQLSQKKVTDAASVANAKSQLRTIALTDPKIAALLIVLGIQ